jgi:hypothetical protein
VTPEEMGDCRDHGTQSKGELRRSAMQSELATPTTKPSRDAALLTALEADGEEENEGNS